MTIPSFAQNLVSCFPRLDIVGEAADGESACKLAQLLQPDIILMDIEMPKINGIDATRWIKAVSPHVCVIGLSIHQSRTWANLMKAAGTTAFLTKDATPDEFYRVIHSMFTTHDGGVSSPWSLLKAWRHSI